MNQSEINNLKQNAQSNTYKTHGKIEDADCVIGFSFGYIEEDGKHKPGKSNLQLAKYIENNFSSHRLILQSEISEALQFTKPDLIISEHRLKGEYLNSREISEQALEYMDTRGWSTAIIVTHPAMEARNIAICQKLGIETIAPPGLEKIDYDEKSAQEWTRDKDSWWQREEDIIEQCVNNNWV